MWKYNCSYSFIFDYIPQVYLPPNPFINYGEEHVWWVQDQVFCA